MNRTAAEIRGTREKEAAVKDNPFAAFLATRQSKGPKPVSPQWRSQESQDADPILLAVGKASREALTRSVKSGGLGLPSSPSGDHFSTFLALGPARCMPKYVHPAMGEAMLRGDVLRAKQQLLEVTAQTELR